MWYEIVPVPQGRQFRYSVIFSNEDGGTATDRLMATWGRTTDIEFVYGVTLDRQGKVVAEEFQGPNTKSRRSAAGMKAAHPLQWVSTDNNMVSESGPTEIRYAPAPAAIRPDDVSREVVMDAHPWTYTLAAKEMVREKKLSRTRRPGPGGFPTPRRFVFVEACTELQNAAVAFSVRAPDASGDAALVRRGSRPSAVPHRPHRLFPRRRAAARRRRRAGRDPVQGVLAAAARQRARAGGPADASC